MNDLFDQKILDFLSNLEEESFYNYTQNTCEKTRISTKEQKRNYLSMRTNTELHKQ